MKKNVYIEPTLRVVELELHKLMNGSIVTNTAGNVFNGDVKPGDGAGDSAPRSSEWYGEDEDYEEEW